MLEKFKEKKVTVVEALANALDAVFASVSFAEIVEDVVAVSIHKVPQVKSESIRWLVRCLQTTKKPPAKEQIKIMGEMLMKTIDDSNNDVRELSAEALGTMLRILGERPMLTFLDRLKGDKIKDTKVREFAEKVEVKVAGAAPKPQAASTAGAAAGKAGSNGRPTTASATRTVPSFGSRSMVIKPTGAPKKTATTSSTSSASPAPSGSKASKPAARAAAAPVVEEAPITFKWNDESAEEAAIALLEEGTLKGLGDSVWKARLEGALSL